MKFSFSRLKKFEDCPWGYYMKYVLKYETPDTEPLVVGRIVHKAIELIISRSKKIGSKYYDIHNDRPKYEDALKDAIELIDSPIKDQLNFNEMLYMVQNACPYPGMGEVERHFELALTEDMPPASIQGYIDLNLEENGTLYVTDWKTGRVTNEVLDNQQIPLYAWAIKQATGTEKQIVGRLNFVRTGDIKEDDITNEDMDKAFNWAKQNAEDITNRLLEVSMGNDPEKVFGSNSGSHCRWCDCPDKCPLSKQAVKDQEEKEEKANSNDDNKNSNNEKSEKTEIKNYKDAEEVANEVMLLEARTKELKEKLKKYVEANGSVTAGDQVFDFITYDKWEFKDPDKKKEMAMTLLDNGINFWNIIDYGKKQVDQVIKKGFPEEEVLKYGQKKTARVFKPTKANNSKAPDKSANTQKTKSKIEVETINVK